MNEREQTIKNSGSSILETSTNSQINKAEISFLHARKKNNYNKNKTVLTLTGKERK